MSYYLCESLRIMKDSFHSLHASPGSKDTTPSVDQTLEGHPCCSNQLGGGTPAHGGQTSQKSHTEVSCHPAVPWSAHMRL